MNYQKQSALDELTTFIKAKMPKTIYLLRNKGRYEEIVNEIDKIKQFILNNDPDAKFSITKDELLGLDLSLEVECTLLAITDVYQFCSVIKNANSIDIVPLANGKLSLIFSFADAYMPAPPQN